MKNLSRLIFSGLLLLAGTTASVLAQGQMASGTISSSGSGPYTYDLTFSNAGGSTDPVGSVWYSWIPGFTYLPGDPTSASAPFGWTATLSGNSVQFMADSPIYDIAAGQSLSGFSYVAAFTPAQLAAAPNGNLSVAYSGGLFSDGGDTFTVAASSVPEPSTAALLVLGALGLRAVNRRKTCAA